MEAIVLVAVLVLVVVGIGAQWKENIEDQHHGMNEYTPEEALRRVAYLLECDATPTEVTTKVEGLVTMLEALQDENHRLKGERG